MKKILFLLVGCGLMVFSFAQIKPTQNKTTTPPAQTKNDKKYSSLLWEISGNGLKKPSYLFGTMHVSDKLAFHLGDSFYNALKSVQVVALETNPEYWQDDFSKSSFLRGEDGMNFVSRMYDFPSDRMSLSSFSIGDYIEPMKASLALEPSLVNGLLYRTYGSQMDDFEEDTYLDMYIFQAGKKLGKHLTGVENFEESEKLVKEAYRDMFKDKNKKRRSADYEGWFTNPKKLEDAYRRGDLDLMDSLQALHMTSAAFEEKFLYKRNEIQAHSIDTILKKNSLFVAVGAAHLPGKRGVIEMLRQMGYKLRPVKMDDRNSRQKDDIDKTHFPTRFLSQNSEDGFYQVSIPGKKFYRFTEWNGMDVVQYADMVNGAYYMVNRIKTNSLLWGHSADVVHKRIDSFMYENIPGKILKKTAITKNGYKGWEILNRTRRGDYQRYNIFVTPFEIIIFKMSGNGDFINYGTEAKQFFGSVKLKEYQLADWVKYQPPTGGFSIQLPHKPSGLKDDNFGADRIEYSAFDRNGNNYLIMQSNLHNYAYAEEDSFELNLMDDSYAFSSFVSKQTSRQFEKQNGYPALRASYLHKDGTSSTVKYIIRGPLYYVLVAHYKKEDANVKQFFQSFALTPFIYPQVKPWTDTAMHYTVSSPIFLDTTKRNQESINEFASMFGLSFDDEEDVFGLNQYKTALIGNDTLGEKIFITYSPPAKYAFEKDSVKFWKSLFGDGLYGDTTFIKKLDKSQIYSNNYRVRELHLTDTGSSRLIMSKAIYKNGHFYNLMALTDTLSERSLFLQQFFSTFTPADTLKGESVFARKTDQFFKDFFSSDSATAKKARRSMQSIEFDSTDLANIKMATEKLNWGTKNYLETKQFFISRLGDLKDPSIVPFLRDLYVKVKDTADLQTTILQTLLSQRTKESFKAFKDLILQEPPISDGSYGYNNYSDLHFPIVRLRRSFAIDDTDEDFNYGPWSELYDTLALTKTIFPDMLQLMEVEDYKKDVKDLLTKLVDSGYLKASDYENHFSKLYLDAKQLMKKQVAGEEKYNIDKLNRKDRPVAMYFGYDEDDEDRELEAGNDELEQYSILLLPFYDKNPGIPGFFEQLLKSKDKKLVYETFILLARNNRPVPDSLYLKYAKLDQYRSELYKDLKKMKKLEKFPAAYKSQEQIVRSLFLKDKTTYNKPDSVVFMDKLPVTYKDKQGYVYFFKYREERDDNYWKLASVGMQPANQDSVDLNNHVFDEEDDRKLENDKPEREQLEKMLKELLYATRPIAHGFYESRNYSLYKTYLPEMVKSRRYRD